MRIVTWNINGSRGIGKSRRADIIRVLRVHAPDVIVLQEVATLRGLHSALIAELGRYGWTHVRFSGDPDATSHRYGNLLVSRYALNSPPQPPVAAPHARSVVRAVVHAPKVETPDAA